MNENHVGMQETDGILWQISEDGVLRIAKAENGDGSIPSERVYSGCNTTYDKDDGQVMRREWIFEGVYRRPWSLKQGRTIKEVIIEEGITKISGGSFQDFKNCKKIVIPDTVEVIGEWAFRFCECLESISLPDGIQRIEEETFLGCKSLTSIEFPDGLTYIGKKAFCYCESLKTVRIPNCVERIGENAFQYCKNLRKAYVPKDKIEEFSKAFEEYTCGTYSEFDPKTFRSYNKFYELGTKVIGTRSNKAGKKKNNNDEKTIGRQSFFSKLFGKRN